jgi:hypothetical protein
MNDLWWIDIRQDIEKVIDAGKGNTYVPVYYDELLELLKERDALWVVVKTYIEREADLELYSEDLDLHNWAVIQYKKSLVSIKEAIASLPRHLLTVQREVLPPPND